MVRLVGTSLALVGTVAGDAVEVDDGLVEKEEVGALRRVQVEPVAAVGAADGYGQNGERQVDQPNCEIGKWMRQGCLQASGCAMVEPGLRSSPVRRTTHPLLAYHSLWFPC